MCTVQCSEQYTPTTANWKWPLAPSPALSLSGSICRVFGIHIQIAQRSRAEQSKALWKWAFVLYILLSFSCHRTIFNQKLDVFLLLLLALGPPLALRPVRRWHISSLCSIYILLLPVYSFWMLYGTLFFLKSSVLFTSIHIVCANVWVCLSVSVTVVFLCRLVRLCSISRISAVILQSHCARSTIRLLSYFFRSNWVLFSPLFPPISTLLHFVDSGCVLVLY